MSYSSVILCGGARPARTSTAAREPLHLNLHGNPTNVHLRVDDISERMLATPSDVLLDLLEVATYVFCADQAIRRGQPTAAGDNWYRSLEFHVPVRNVDLWSYAPVTEALVAALSHLTDDDYTFTFHSFRHPPSHQKYFPQLCPDFETDEVALFSGGLDSLAGLLDASVRHRRRLTLVTHRAATKSEPTFCELVATLQRRVGSDRVFPVPVWITKATQFFQEHTQRTRSFLYASIGAVIAAMSGQDVLTIYENGVTSINLPISPAIVGTRASRTTHPASIRHLSDLLSQVLDRRFTISTPFIWHTKSDVVRIILELGYGSLVEHTRSCSRTLRSTRDHAHCGTCYQCTDRRFAVLAAGCAGFDPGGRYKVDLLAGPRQIDDRTLADQYVQHATRILEATEAQFFTDYPEAISALDYIECPPEEAPGRILDLHRRHARDVLSVLDNAISSSAYQLRTGSLPDSCLVVLAATGPYARTAAQHPTFRLDGHVWCVWFSNESAMLSDSVGARYVSHLLAHPTREFSALELTRLVTRVPEIERAFSFQPLADTAAISDYRKRRRELTQNLEHARSSGRSEQAAELAEELGELDKHLASVTAKGGIPRPMASQAERARKSVHAAIRRFLTSLDTSHPALRRHLRSSLKTGGTCSYAPDPLVTWLTQ